MKTPWRTISYRFFDCWGFATPRLVQGLLLERAQKRNPLLAEYVETQPGVFDRKHKDLWQSTWDIATKRTPLVCARLHKRMEYVSSQNQAMLDGMTQNEAVQALTALERGCLAWFERLPIGISAQLASDKTGISFYVSSWHSNIQNTEHYTPNSKVKKLRVFAKAI